MLIKADLHNHTTFSFDGEMTPRALVDLYAEKGFGAVAVTDHGTRLGALAVRDLDPPFQVIVGCEIKTSHGELIGLFLNEDIRQGMDAVDTAKAIHDVGGLTLLPHPFLPNVLTRMAPQVLKELLPHLDIVEGINARGDNALHDQNAFRWGSHHNRALSAGSDAHTPAAAGSGYVLMEPFQDTGDFLEKLYRATLVCTGREPMVRAVFNLLRGYTLGRLRVRRMRRLYESGAPLRELWDKAGKRQRPKYW